MPTDEPGVAQDQNARNRKALQIRASGLLRQQLWPFYSPCPNHVMAGLGPAMTT
jgi:hypothetical protein